MVVCLKLIIYIFHLIQFLYQILLNPVFRSPCSLYYFHVQSSTMEILSWRCNISPLSLPVVCSGSLSSPVATHVLFLVPSCPKPLSSTTSPTTLLFLGSALTFDHGTCLFVCFQILRVSCPPGLRRIFLFSGPVCRLPFLSSFGHLSQALADFSWPWLGPFFLELDSTGLLSHFSLPLVMPVSTHPKSHRPQRNSLLSSLTPYKGDQRKKTQLCVACPCSSA